MSGAVPLLPHVLSQRAQDFLYTQGLRSLVIPVHVPERTDSAIQVCEQPGSTDIARRSVGHLSIQWQGLALLNVITGNNGIECVISMPTRSLSTG